MMYLHIYGIKSFRKNVLEGIKFDEALSVGEDRLFIFETLPKIRGRYKVINKCLYLYVRNADLGLLVLRL